MQLMTILGYTSAYIIASNALDPGWISNWKTACIVSVLEKQMHTCHTRIARWTLLPFHMTNTYVHGPAYIMHQVLPINRQHLD
jgi:hypothetical protein